MGKRLSIMSLKGIVELAKEIITDDWKIEYGNSTINIYYGGLEEQYIDVSIRDSSLDGAVEVFFTYGCPEENIYYSDTRYFSNGEELISYLKKINSMPDGTMKELRTEINKLINNYFSNKLSGTI